MKRLLNSAILVVALSTIAVWGRNAQNPPRSVPVSVSPSYTSAIAVRPRYRLRANLDLDLLTFSADGTITVPVQAGDNVSNVSFFIFANAGGVGGSDYRRSNVRVDAVTWRGQNVPFNMSGAVLKVSLPTPETGTFDIGVKWHGIVPRSPAGAGDISDMMGGDIGDVLGGALGGAPKTKKPENIDYGLYCYGNGILSMGPFWYPTLAVRRNGRWIDEAPEGLGDVAYADMSDYDVELRYDAPGGVDKWQVAAPGGDPVVSLDSGLVDKRYSAHDVREFAVLMSEDYEVKKHVADIGGKNITISTFARKGHEEKAAKSMDIAEHALRSYDRLYGPYRYSSFKVVEGPLRGGAGGMEYSGMTAIASMLYEDLGKELGQMVGGATAGLGGDGTGISDSDLQKLMGGDDDTAPAAAHAIAAPAPGDSMKSQNPAALAESLLGQQKGMLDSLFEMTVAHETAHQWWAIGVGSDSQRAPWLDESLANYSAILYFEDRYGAATAAQVEDFQIKTAYSMGRMLGNEDAPVNLRTSAYTGNMQYGAIVYGKGALFYGALRKLMGDAAFFSGLRAYYGRYNGRLATAADLIGCFEAAAPAKAASIAALEKHWIEEKHGDEDITGGAPPSLADMLGGLMGGATGDQ